MSYLDRIKAFKAPDLAAYLPFVVDGLVIGYVKPDFALKLRDFPNTFRAEDSHLQLNEILATPEHRSAAVADVLERLMQSGVVPGWRGEKYKVATSFAAQTLFEMERAAAPLFGIIAYGVHLNGVVETGHGRAMWIGRRSLNKPVAPGKLDQIVAGGQPSGLSLKANLLKECAEEADIPPGLAGQSVPVGAISYIVERPDGLRRDVLFVYDLVLPESFQPHNTDGEMEDFRLMSMAEICASVGETEDFKFNCALVVIDYLIRHGVIEPDHAHYTQLIAGLHKF